MKKVLFGMAVCAAVFAGCQEEATESLPKDYSKFTATFEDGGSRVILDSEDYASWKANDKVSVFNESGTHYTYTADKDGRETTLSGPADAAFTNDIFALFPYKESKTETDKAGNVYKYGNWYENRTLVSELATEQVYGDAMNHAIMVAKIPATEDKFVFKNSCALVKININTTSELANRVKINSINIKSESQNLSGTVTIGSDYTAHISKGSANSVALTGCSAAGLLGTDYQSFLLVIPAGTYPEGDLKITIDTNQEADYVETTDLDYIATLPKAYTVRRSQYIELKTTLNNLKATELTDKAIMANNYNLVNLQGFYDQYEVPTEYELPTDGSHINCTIPNGSTPNEDDSNNRIYNFKTTDAGIFIINNFTTAASGVKAVLENPPHLTVNNITIQGELRGTSMGIWVPGSGDNHQGAYSTTFNNVNILNNQIIAWSKEEGAALSTFGKAVLNNCKVTGTVRSEKDGTDIPIYDLVVTNASHAYLNGGEFGHCKVKGQAYITINQGAVVDKLSYWGISVVRDGKSLGNLTVNAQATVNELIVDPDTYLPQVDIKGDAIIPLLKFDIYKNDGVTKKVKADYFANVSIDANAKISKIIVGDKEFTDLSAFLTYMKETEW